jgi:protein O-mannosyl-transferase
MIRFLHRIKPAVESKKNFIIVLFLVLTTLTIYWQTSSHTFTNFDDPDYVVINPYVHKGISFDSISWAFHIPQTGEKIETYWHPLTWLSHMLDYQFFGLNAGMHHLINVLYHIVNTLLLYLVLMRMTGSSWRSAFVAALFALHPINVDSVAWVAERKNLLSTFFWILTMLAYLHYTKKSNISRYIILVAVFILGLLSKPMLVTLPFVLLLLDYWPLRRISLIFPEQIKIKKKDIRAKLNFQYQGVPIQRLILEKVPLLIFSLISMGISSLSLSRAGVIVAAGEVPIGLRFENAIVSYMKYMWKMIWPSNLTVFYPYPESIPLWQIIVAPMLIILISFLALKFIFRAPYFIVGWLWFLGTLVPVSGLMQGGLWPEIAERWAYVPLIGLFIIIGWGIPDVIHGWQHRRVVLAASPIILLLILMMISWRQVGFWKDNVSLFSHALEVNNENFVAYSNLAAAYANQGKKEKAIYFYKEALRINTNDLIALNSLGGLYNEIGQKDKAIFYYSEAVRYKPNDKKANFELGTILFNSGNLDRAYQQFSHVVSLDPNFALAYYNLGVISAKKGNNNKSVEYLLHALKLNPNDIETHLSAGIVLMNLGRVNDAIYHFKEALRIDPKSSKAQGYLSKASNYTKKANGDIYKLEQRKLKEPGNSELLHELAVLYSFTGDYAKALDVLYTLIKIQPDNPDGYYNIACIYAKEEKINESMEWLNKSIDKGFNNWDLLQKDKDLDNLRTTQYYKDLIERAYQ